MTFPTPNLGITQDVLMIAESENDGFPYRVFAWNNGLKIYSSYRMDTEGYCESDGERYTCGTSRRIAQGYFHSLLMTDLDE